jgi:hypothetical protein
MTIAFLIFLIAPLVLVALMYMSGTRSLRKLITVPVAFYSLPVLVVIGFYLLRTPIQQGRFLAQLGPILSLVFPPEDLYVPLASISLELDKVEYSVDFTHKYVGYHAVEISIPGKSKIGKIDPELRVFIKVFLGDKLVYEGDTGPGYGFWGKEDYGLHFSRYGVPKELPVSRSLRAEFHVQGDLNAFLEGREKATIGITKVSDE